MLFFHFDYLADATIDLSMDKIVLFISNSFYWFKEVQCKQSTL